MGSHVGPDLDTSAMREHFTSAISEYEEARQKLQQNQVTVRAGDFGEGFLEEGQAVIDALDSLRKTTQDFLHTREQSWKSILALVDDIESQDTDSSTSFRGVDEL